MKRLSGVSPSDIARLVKSRAAADLLVTFGGRVSQLLLALAGSIISARVLGPADFGRFGLVIATVSIFGTLADAGLTYTAVKFIAQRHAEDDGSALEAGRVYLLLRVLAGALVMLLGLSLAAPIAGLALGHADLTPYLQLAFLTLAGLSISSYPGTVLVGLSSFKRLGLAGVLNAAITLLGILALFLVGRLELSTLIAWNVVLPLASTLPAWFMLPAEWLPWRLRWRPLSLAAGSLARQMLAFSKWMGLSLLGSMLASQGDLILLGRLAEPAVVGAYSVALTLALRLDTLNQSLIFVMMPRASRLKGQAEMRLYSRRALSGSLGLAVLLGLFALLAQPLISLLYGERYSASSGLFLALVGVVLFDLATSSLFLVALPLNRPRLLAAGEWLRVGVLGAAGVPLISGYSGYGAVTARFLSRLAGAAYTLYTLRRAVDEVPGEPATAEVADVIQST
jgi:O-antigen/teichoic acid export membrane protein